MRRFQAAFAIAALLASTACGSSSSSDSSTSPSTTTVNIGGNWSGTLSDSQLGNGTVTATFIQTDKSVIGTWAGKYSNPANNNSGTLTGNIDGSNVTMLLTPVPQVCTIRLTAVSDGKTMVGNYTTINCSETVTGQINVTKQ